MNAKSERRFGARILLPVEMLLYGILAILAISGGAGRGALWTVLDLVDGNSAWLVFVGGIGASGLAVSAWEWFFGARWENRRLLCVAMIRMWCSILAISAWSYILYVLFTVPGGQMIFAIALNAPWAVLFHLWAVLVLKRLYVILHSEFPTSRLRARLEHSDRGF